MKYSEALLLINELRNKEVQRQKYREYYTLDYARLHAYTLGMKDIIRALCDRGVIDNKEELEREKEGGF